MPSSQNWTGGETSPVSLRVTQEAVAPAAPVSPRPLLNLAAGVLAGLLLGAGVVALRETLDTTLKTIEALSEFTKLPGLATIPYDRSASKQPLVSAYGHSGRAEAFRKLRTNLQFSQVDDPPRIIVVTSSVSGEGKTNTAANLALLLAEAGVSTCLVDADLRRPCVASAFGLVRDAGLATVLIGQARVADVLQQVAGRRHRGARLVRSRLAARRPCRQDQAGSGAHRRGIAGAGGRARPRHRLQHGSGPQGRLRSRRRRTTSRTPEGGPLRRWPGAHARSTTQWEVSFRWCEASVTMQARAPLHKRRHQLSSTEPT